MLQVALTSLAIGQSQFETNFQDVFQQPARGVQRQAGRQQGVPQRQQVVPQRQQAVPQRSSGRQEEARQEQRETTTVVPILKQINE